MAALQMVLVLVGTRAAAMNCTQCTALLCAGRWCCTAPRSKHERHWTHSSPTLPSPPLDFLPCSIGSLGSSSSQACVYNVDVSNCQLSNLQNGLRIKTYQGGMGSVYNVRYRNVQLSNVANPIYITQVRSLTHSILSCTPTCCRLGVTD